MSACDDVQRYIDDVLTGRRVTGRLEQLAVVRHLHDLEHAAQRGYVFDEEQAERVVAFYHLCRHTKGEWRGKPIELSGVDLFITWCLFGWVSEQTGFRRFRRAFLSFARKKGKSTWSAATALYLLMMDDEPGAEGYIVATSEAQARVVYDDIVRMARIQPAFLDRLWILNDRVEYPYLEGVVRPITGEASSADGLNPHFIIRDELHAWREHHRALAEKMSSAMGARRQPLEITITTAGDENSNVWIEEYQYATSILESSLRNTIIADTWFVLLAQIDWPLAGRCILCHEDNPFRRVRRANCPACKGTGTAGPDDPQDERIWVKANPLLGDTPKLEYLRDQAHLARVRPEKQVEWLRYHCNVRVTSRQQAIPPELWSACAGTLTRREKMTCYVGLDIAHSDDFAAVSVVFPIEVTDADGMPQTIYEVESRSFTCQKPRHSEMVQRWIREGLLHECDGEVIALTDVRDHILSLNERYTIAALAYDPHFAKIFAEDLLNNHGIHCVVFRQNYSVYNEPTRRLLSLLKEKLLIRTEKRERRETPPLRHNGDPVLAWQASNLIIRKNARDEVMPARLGPDKKIDGVVALIMALGAQMHGARAEKPRGYDEAISFAFI